jgi:hypothetical protein
MVGRDKRPARWVVPAVNVLGLVLGLVGGMSRKPKRRRHRGRDEHRIRRACIECTEVYIGHLACPACGAPGEPLDE